MKFGKKIGLIFKIAISILLAIVIYSTGFINGYERAGTLSAGYPKRMGGTLSSVAKMIRCEEHDRAEKALIEISEFAGFFAEQAIKDAKRPRLTWLLSSPNFFFVDQTALEKSEDSISPSDYSCEIIAKD